ncbi:hypothetical protein nbrc107697_33060 [Gordonia crocea]|uniref:Uncharacterized protein n=1 Tax=Gordonia crocea TaxID=589162 RepID=A0A7I9V1D9_9ACTN|nr:hypothetical protein nbrc107697_33060 [Gordonia crocea]
MGVSHARTSNPAPALDESRVVRGSFVSADWALDPVDWALNPAEWALDLVEWAPAFR